MVRTHRGRMVAAIGVGLALVAGIAISVASTSTAADDRWVTAVATTGDVTQNYVTTGSITRTNTAEASFTVSGTVSSVAVTVGDAVSADDVLAKVKTGPLKLAVLEAESAVAKAEAALYSAKHPSSSSSGSQSKTDPNLVSVDAKALTKAAAAVNDAVAAEQTACEPVLGATEEEPTEEQIEACAAARTKVTEANAALQQFITAMSKAGPKKTSSPTTTSVSASKVASAKADLLEAQQKLTDAEEDLDAATLVAPISGTVGTVGLSKGGSASAGSITIVGKGSAELSIEVPRKTRDLISVGQEVAVTPAGASDSLAGKITAINVLATDGTSGDSPTYATTIQVTDGDMKLASGARASVSIPVKAVTGVVTVPASAVTPTGTGTGTVQVLATAAAETPQSVEVSTGAVGGGRVEIVEGVSAGQIVILADRTAEIPANATRRRSTTSSSSSTSRSTATASAAPTAASTDGGSAGESGPEPTATR